MFRFFRSKNAQFRPDATSNELDINVDTSAILMRFRTAAKLHTKLMQSMWEEHIGVKYEDVINDLIVKGKLRPPTTEEGLQLATVRDVKTALAKESAALGGNKQQLIQRLLEVAPTTSAEVSRSVSAGSYVLSDDGWNQVKQYEELLENYRVRTRELIRQHKAEQACEAADEYRQLIPPPIRGGLNVVGDDSAMMHSYLNRVTYLLGLTESDAWVLEEIPTIVRDDIIALTIDRILGVGETNPTFDWESKLPRKIDAHISLLENLAANHEFLAEARKLGGKVSISSCNDADVCETCQAITKKIFTVDSIPLLPYQGCTNQPCRCSYRAIFF